MEFYKKWICKIEKVGFYSKIDKKFYTNWCKYSKYFVRASVSREAKFLAFNISKHYFIYFNTSFYNISNIKGSIFLQLHLNIIIFILSLCFFLSILIRVSPFLYVSLPFPKQTHHFLLYPSKPTTIATTMTSTASHHH